jgi:uncharacterized membrane protein YphA (DoxX/SURF4 family)
VVIPKLADKQKLLLTSLLLRVGLALVFLYAGVSALRTPSAWIGFVPSFVARFSSLKFALDTISVAQIGLAIWLLTGKFLKYAGVVAIGLLLGIIVFNPGALLVTFRDIAALSAAMALVILDL